MKKLLLVLAVVAMASFLFVGCLPGGTTPDPDPDPDPDPTPTITIVVDGEYYDASKGLTYVQGCVPKLVTVTFAEPVAEEYGVQINGISAVVTADSDRKIWTKEITLDESQCTEVCITVTVGHPCCPDLADTYWKLVVPDCEAPCASFTVTFKDCECEVPAGAEMSWTTTCEDECDVPKDCCGDDCSGVGVWTFTLDLSDDVCAPGECDLETDSGCAISGAFECGCLSYEDAEAEPALTGIHEVLVSIKDNVGNEFTDTWTITFDTDNVTGVVAPLAATVSSPSYDAVNDEWTVEIDYGCEWDDCDICFPSET